MTAGKKSVGVKLRGWRKACGVSQAEAARRMGVSPATWSEWESDKQIPRIDAALRLADMTAQAVSLEDMAKAASRARAAMKLRHERGAA